MAAAYRMALVVVLASACGLPPKPKPQLAAGVTHESLRSEVSAICVYPLAVEETLLQEERRAQLDRQIIAALERGGFRTVHVGDSDELWVQTATEVGGYFDPHTGEIDESKHESLVRVYRSRLSELHGCQAFLGSSINVVTVPWLGKKALWDGAEVEMPGGEMGEFGHVPGLSLWVKLEDGAGSLLYFGTGGISIASRLKQTGWFSKDFERIAMEEVLNDDSRNAEAIALALSTLLESPPPAPSAP